MTSTRHIGNCQICERDQKLHNGQMVHHGYTRPGHGFIKGDCPGVAEVPYEVSCDLIKEHIVNLHLCLQNWGDYLGRLQAGEVTALYVEEGRGLGPRALVRLEAGTPEAEKHEYGHTKWENAIRRAVAKAESDIRYAKFDIDHCEKRVADWKPMPIRTIEEEQAKQDADKAGRKAIKDAARNARLAKMAATKVKQDALKAKRQAIKDEFQAKFLALATSPEPIEVRKSKALELYAETRKSKYSWMIVSSNFTCDDAFILLGLAVATGVRPDGRKRNGHHVDA
jgi:hypothetical protein